jgi:hypothetical protein
VAVGEKHSLALQAWASPQVQPDASAATRASSSSPSGSTDDGLDMDMADEVEVAVSVVAPAWGLTMEAMRRGLQPGSPAAPVQGTSRVLHVSTACPGKVQ